MSDKLKSFMKQLQNSWKSWTIWVNGIAGAFLAGLPMLQETLPQLQAYVSADLFKYAMASVITANLLLRFKTKTALGDK